jgi:hypothetical protein
MLLHLLDIIKIFFVTRLLVLIVFEMILQYLLEMPLALIEVHEIVSPMESLEGEVDVAM